MDSVDVAAAIVLADNANRELRHIGCVEGLPVIGYVEVLRPHPVDFASQPEYWAAVDAGGLCSKCGQRIEGISS